MEYNYHENSHSNILEYIFDYNLIGKEGISILSDFVSGFALIENKEGLISKIKKRKYTLHREFPVSINSRKGRIDLLIKDSINKFVIVVENKIFASVSIDDEDYSQLDLYRDFVNKHYSTYSRVFIIISHREIDRNFNNYVIGNYNDLYTILKKYDIDDNILIDYKMLLYSINNNIDNKKEIVRRVNSIKNNKIKSLNTLEQIRGIINEFK